MHVVKLLRNDQNSNRGSYLEELTGEEGNRTSATSSGRNFQSQDKQQIRYQIGGPTNQGRDRALRANPSTGYCGNHQHDTQLQTYCLQHIQPTACTNKVTVQHQKPKNIKVLWSKVKFSSKVFQNFLPHVLYKT